MPSQQSLKLYVQIEFVFERIIPQFSVVGINLRLSCATVTAQFDNVDNT